MENNHKRYLVRLTPIDVYFFGGEVTFGDGNTQNYLVKSNLLPQQSAVLGLMRYELLRQNDLLFEKGKSIEEEDKYKIKTLIGTKGFDPTQEAKSYGIIKRISPIFIEKQGQFYTRMPLDAGIKVKLGKDTDTELKAYYNGSDNCKPLPIFEEYNYKEYKNYRYWCSKDINNIKDESKIFIETEQIGINKNKKDDAFFKQTLIKLSDGFNFAFTVDIEGKLNTESAIVPWGGNQSRFKIEITECNESNLEGSDFCEYFKPLANENRILLLGDAIIPDATRDKIDFIWGNCIENRYIVSKVADGHSWGKPTKTEELYHLQSRGSVIYHNAKENNSTDSIKNLEEIKNELNNQSYQAIGLNIFI